MNYGGHHQIIEEKESCFLLYKKVISIIFLEVISIVENYYNRETVEQKAMFIQRTVKLMFAFYNNMMMFQKKNCQIVAKCDHEFYSTLVNTL